MPRVFTQTFGVVGAILEREGKFLLVRESNRKGPDDGKWNQPAGWVDVGENPLEAVRREVEEETGLALIPTHIVGIYSLVRKDIEKELGATPHAIKIIFTGIVSDSETSALADDITETRWFSPEEIYAMNGAVLRDADIKQEVKDYLAGKKYPLEMLHHTVSR